MLFRGTSKKLRQLLLLEFGSRAVIPLLELVIEPDLDELEKESPFNPSGLDFSVDRLAIHVHSLTPQLLHRFVVCWNPIEFFYNTTDASSVVFDHTGSTRQGTLRLTFLAGNYLGFAEHDPMLQFMRLASASLRCVWILTHPLVPSDALVEGRQFIDDFGRNELPTLHVRFLCPLNRWNIVGGVEEDASVKCDCEDSHRGFEWCSVAPFAVRKIYTCKVLSKHYLPKSTLWQVHCGGCMQCHQIPF